MRSNIWIFVIFIAIFCEVVSAKERIDLFSDFRVDVTSAKNEKVDGDRKSKLRGTAKIASPFFRDINLSSEVGITLPGKVTQFLQVRRVDRKGDNRFAFTAFDKANKNTLHLARRGDKVVGSMIVDGRLYKLRPGIDGMVQVLEVDYESLKDHGESYSDIPVSYSAGGLNAQVNSASLTEFTVIVAYTAAFARDAGNVDAYMDLLEEETNAAFENSNVNTRMKIAYYYQTTYSGQGGDFAADMAYLADEAHQETKTLNVLRNTYGADIMMLLVGNEGYTSCGRASAIGANASNALAAAREDCAAGYYSFGHEIGHLFGARHIYVWDPQETPFRFGHGYCNPVPNTWRTIMAYYCPLDTGGTRIQQWSNPEVVVGGYPTGTTELEFNAQVLNIRAAEVAAFRGKSGLATVLGFMLN